MTTKVKLTDDQQSIYDDITYQVNNYNGRFDCHIQGPAGTGKSTLIAQIIKDISFGFTVGVTSPTHKANRVLGKMLNSANVDMDNCDIMTIHSFLGLKLVRKKAQQVLELDRKSPNSKKKVDVLIIDECSMISYDMYQYIISQSHRVRRAIIFLGDICQLPPVEPEKLNTTLSVTFNHGTKYELVNVLRQALNNPIIKIATAIRQCIGTKNNPMQVLNFAGDLDTVVKVTDDEFYETFLSMLDPTDLDVLMQNINDNKILAYTNAKVDEWNSVVRLSLFPEETEEFFAGEPILFDGPGANCPYMPQEVVACPGSLKKEVWFGIDCWSMVGEDGKLFYVVGPKTMPIYKAKCNEIIENIEKGAINKLTKRPYSWADYYVIAEKITSASYPYAQTLHKSQGATFESIWLDLSSMYNVRNIDDVARLLYTAVTRPRQAILIAK